MKTFFGALALALLLPTVPVSAETPDFEAADTDQDEYLSLEEAATAVPEITPAQFKEADIDKSKGLDVFEFNRAVELGLIVTTP